MQTVSSPRALPAYADAPGGIPRVVRALLHLFFRRIEVTGLENVPRDRGGVLVAWHPNGLLDPALILAECPRPVVFGARHGLLRWPLLGPLLRRLGTVPIFRPQDTDGTLDPEARRQANRESLDRLAEAVVQGRFAALFPEGVSHDDSAPRCLRPGAARLFLRALELARRDDPVDRPPPVLLTVGLHYDRKHLFGSSVLIEFHAPLALSEALSGAPASGEDSVEAVERITGRLAAELDQVVQATDTWDTHHLIHRLRKVVRAERARRSETSPGPSSMEERVLGFARVRQAYEVRQGTHPGETRALRERVEEYDRDLGALGLDDHDLDGGGGAWEPLRALGLALGAVLVYLVLPPLLVLGYAVNVPVALGLGALARRLGGEKKDVATLKLLFGVVAFPVVWALVALLVVWGQLNLHDAYPEIPRAPWLAGMVTFALCSVGGWVGLAYLRVAAGLYRALRVRLTKARRRRAVARLLAARAALFADAMELASGLDLPGAVFADGRVARAASTSGADRGVEV
jgi:1-acyl-sn-glycerol-3-phosphate acyltransferase